jgi:hypothetical protein
MLPVRLSTHVRNYSDVFRFVGRKPSSARDALVPPEPARGPAAVQGDRPTLQSSAPDSLLYLRRGGIGAFLGFILPAVALAQSYTVSVISPPSGFTITSVSGINNSGQVAGSVTSGSTLSSQAFIGSPAGSVLIPMPSGWTYSYGNGINNPGQVTGLLTNVPTISVFFGPSASFIGTASGSAAIPVPSGWSGANALGINDAGQVAGSRLDSNGSELQAFIGSSAGLTPIPLPAGAAYARGTAINASGQVTGFAGFGAGASAYTGSFIGTASGNSLVPLPSGFNEATGVAINSSGQVAGTATMSGVAPRAFIGTSLTIATIPLPAGALLADVASGSLTDSGVTVGFSDAGGWIWSASTGSQLLNSLAPPGWNISNAISISQNGRILAVGSYNRGAVQYIELVPVVPATPAPGTGLLTIAGLLLVFAWRFRSRIVA